MDAVPQDGGCPDPAHLVRLAAARRSAALFSRRTGFSLQVIGHGFGISISLPCTSARSTF